MNELRDLKNEAEAIDYCFDRVNVVAWRLRVESALDQAFGKNSSYARELRAVKWFRRSERSASIGQLGEEYALARAQTRVIMEAAVSTAPPPQIVSSKTLYLVEIRARKTYVCAACGDLIRTGEAYFRHDPHPYARQYRGEMRTQWCRRCIESSPAQRHWPTDYLSVPALRVLRPGYESRSGSSEILEPVRVETVGVGAAVTGLLRRDLSAIYQLSPEQFEEFICDRLAAMGYEPRRVGRANSADGGIDILFWSKQSQALPILGAAQVKHHRSRSVTDGPAAIRDFAGALAGHPFNAAIFVTNTRFTPSAEWFARERASVIRLRDFEDIRRWLGDRFGSLEEWREMPEQIELAPGCVVRITRRDTAG